MPKVMLALPAASVTPEWGDVVVLKCAVAVTGVLGTFEATTTVSDPPSPGVGFAILAVHDPAGGTVVITRVVGGLVDGGTVLAVVGGAVTGASVVAGWSDVVVVGATVVALSTVVTAPASAVELAVVLVLKDPDLVAKLVFGFLPTPAIPAMTNNNTTAPVTINQVRR